MFLTKRKNDATSVSEGGLEWRVFLKNILNSSLGSYVISYLR